jgi:hypothetical protein
MVIPGVLFAALVGGLLAGCALLFRSERRRRRVDPAPSRPPTLEEAGLDGWNAHVVEIVAALSIVGAFLAWWASTSFAAAAELGQRALQETTRYQTVQSVQDSKIAFGSRLTQQYQDHTVAESTLYARAGAAWRKGDTDAALLLEAEARVEGAQERAFDPGALYYSPDSPGPDGKVHYSTAEQETTAVYGNQDLRTLDAAHVAVLQGSAETDRTRGERTVLGDVFIFGAVFFLTLAYLGARSRRLLWLVPGILAVTGALVTTLLATLT